MPALRAFQLLAFDLHHGRGLARGAFFDNQHGRDVVFNRVAAPAILTDESRAVFLQLNARTASGADENLQQVLTNGHRFLQTSRKSFTKDGQLNKVRRKEKAGDE
jgi:hypothetical protein